MADKILLIDDDPTTLRLLAMNLELRGYEIHKALRAEEGLRVAYRTQPDLVVLDIMMPDIDGWEVLRRLRELSDVPVIFLTGVEGPKNSAKGLNLGADDYVFKPFDFDDLEARIKARLRRVPKETVAEELVFDGGSFRINFISREVRVRGELIHLTPKEFSLLSVLVRNAGRVMPREDLVAEAWGPEYVDMLESLKLYVHYLRQKIEQNPQRPRYILTSRGVGYRFANL